MLRPILSALEIVMRLGMWAAILLVATLSAAGIAAGQIPGCPGQVIPYGGGYACLCPNGTLANGWPPVCSGGMPPPPAASNIPPGSTDCGGGRYCRPGLKCASGGKCIEKGVADCGGGKFCAPGNKCAKQGGCLPKDSVDCGIYSCNVGQACAANRKCVADAHAQRLRGGGALDTGTARNVRPSAVLVSEAYARPGKAASRLGFQHAGDWQSLLAKSGKTKADIEEWRKAGFAATVFTKGSEKLGDRKVVIAFKGPEPGGLPPHALRDWIRNNWPSPTTGELPQPYVRAAEFARTVQQQYGPSAQISVTGYSLGATLASFVGSLLKLETTTFDAPTQALAPIPKLGEEAAPNQTNVITAGDPVSDPLADPDETKLLAKANPLPGKTYVVEPNDAKGPTHEPKSILKYIEERAAGKAR